MKPNETDNSLETLENPTGGAPSATVVSDDQPPTGDQMPPPKLPKSGILGRLKLLVSRFNIYMLAFVLVLVITAIMIVIAIRSNNNASNDLPLNGRTLTQEELEQLRNTDATVGDPKQTLSIESNTVFTGNVLVRSDLDVAGTIKVGGTVNLPGIIVAGSSSFENIQASELSITGDTVIQGQATIQESLTVSGNGSFGGTLSAAQFNIQELLISGDLQLNRHIDAGGSTPSKSDGGSLGNGGTASVSGSDTAGTVTINTGSNPSAGCYITVTFAAAFSSTAHVVITPIGSGAAGLNYYLNRSSSSFSVCSTNAPGASATFSFDYVAID